LLLITASVFGDGNPVIRINLLILHTEGSTGIAINY